MIMDLKAYETEKTMTDSDTLVVIETLHRNAAAIRRVGQHALDEARKAGVPVYYTDYPTYGNDVIREYPDGHRERLIGSQAGRDCVVVPIPPRS
jgi:hypothetical protein